VKFADPTPQQTAAERQKMLVEQDALAKEIKVAPDLVKLVMADVGDAS
jgi:hypothetical protein